MMAHILGFWMGLTLTERFTCYAFRFACNAFFLVLLCHVTLHVNIYDSRFQDVYLQHIEDRPQILGVD